MDENHVGATWDRTEVQLCFRHWVSIPPVEVFQKYVIIQIKLFSSCSFNKAALSMAEFMETLYKTRRRNPSDHGFVTVS